MLRTPGLEPIDYLLLGHITLDHTPDGVRLGGTALYSALTAAALGQRVGLVTAGGDELPLPEHEKLQILRLPAAASTTFRLEYSPEGRRLWLEHLAPTLEYYHIPELWRSAPLVHLGPVAGEVNSGMLRQFDPQRVVLTPQGWLRSRSEDGRVRRGDWPEADFALRACRAAVLSREDLRPEQIEPFALAAPLLVLTDGPRPGRMYLEGQELAFSPPAVAEVDPTGAGDIFAAAFFVALANGETPLAAAEFACGLATDSVGRPGLAGIPNTALEVG